MMYQHWCLVRGISPRVATHEVPSISRWQTCHARVVHRQLSGTSDESAASAVAAAPLVLIDGKQNLTAIAVSSARLIGLLP